MNFSGIGGDDRIYKAMNDQPDGNLTAAEFSR